MRRVQHGLGILTRGKELIYGEWEAQDASETPEFGEGMTYEPIQTFTAEEFRIRCEEFDKYLDFEYDGVPAFEREERITNESLESFLFG